jgi:hypothetical protein
MTVRQDMKSFRAVAACLAAAIACQLAGCATESTTRDQSGGSSRGTSVRGSSGDVGSRPLAPERVVPTYALYGRTLYLPIGRIPFNQQTLPIPSPDGRYLAVETGAAPDIPTILAEPGASPVDGTSVMIHELIAPIDGGVPRIEARGEVGPGVMLGRSCHETGFTVEAPQPDGSRWIGIVEWTGAAVRWLVQDEAVNAFAAVGPADRLAWSRRAVDADRFDLVVSVGAREWTLSELDASWLFPTWSDRGEGLFAWRLSIGGELDAVYLPGSTEESMRRGRRTIRVLEGATLSAAFQTVVAHPATVGAPLDPHPRLVFLHLFPNYDGVAVWEPVRRGGERTLLLDRGSFAAAVEPSGFAVYGVGSRLYGRSIERKGEPIQLSVVGTPVNDEVRRAQVGRDAYIPRLTSSEHWPWLLITPAPTATAELDIIGMKPLPVTASNE